MVDILLYGEACPLGQLGLEGGQPGRAAANTAVHHKLGQQGVQFIILHQGLVLKGVKEYIQYTNSCFHHKLDQQGVQLVVLHQGLVLRGQRVQ